MTTVEFSNEFDVLYNNIMSNQAPGLNEYEKSVFLTKAQTELIKNYFNPLGNKYGEGADDSAKRQIDFSELIKTATVASGTITPVPTPTTPLFDSRSIVYRWPSDVLLILNEAVSVVDNSITIHKQILPIHYEEYTRLMSKPYKEPLRFQVWRLVSQGESNSIIDAELIPKTGTTINDYQIRYVRRPQPIILDDLASLYGGVTIDGVGTISQCELNPIIHREILDRAVELAKISYEGDPASLVQINQRNE